MLLQLIELLLQLLAQRLQLLQRFLAALLCPAHISGLRHVGRLLHLVGGLRRLLRRVLQGLLHRLGLKLLP